MTFFYVYDKKKVKHGILCLTLKIILVMAYKLIIINNFRFFFIILLFSYDYHFSSTAWALNTFVQVSPAYVLYNRSRLELQATLLTFIRFHCLTCNLLTILHIVLSTHIQPQGS